MRAEWLERQEWERVKLWLRPRLKRFTLTATGLGSSVMVAVSYAAELHDLLVRIFPILK